MKPEFAKKLASLTYKMQKIRKDKENPFYKSKYANIENVLDQAKPLAEELGLFILQPIQNDSVVTYIVDVDTGDTFPEVNKDDRGLTFKQDDPQKKGGEVTFFRRYSLISLLCLETEDDDGNTASNKVYTQKPKGSGIPKNADLW